MKIIESNEVLENLVIEKKWGGEVIIHNGDDYCGKLLLFKKGAKFSMHFHIQKKETWYIKEGKFKLKYIDTKNAVEYEVGLETGTIVEIDRGDPHQLFALTDGIIFEVSTPHFDDDSYRIKKGDSQIKNNE